MISKNKIIALILGVSLASSATYGSYAYFSGEYSVKNTVKIVELDPKESPFEISKISTRENSLVLEFSKKVFYSGENINSDIVGSETFLDNVEISIEGKEIIISKKDGKFLIPVGIENNLPSIKLNSNFEDRFGKDLEEIILYLYGDSNGNITWSLTNDQNGNKESQSNNEIKGDEGVKPNSEIKEEALDQPNNEVKEESSIENSNNEVENIETPKSGDENTTPVEGENLEQENINGNELNKSLGEGEISNNLTNIN
ncbi:MAG: hypothetical protein E7D79_12395 [Clostridium perfringens]|uniref:Uncharacterized protein n=1 Tax=Clostridium perfringens TaxID=1502 RepID=A0AAW4IZA9_CLOPF|nr:hypothetical protein [Clostridium perfringens]EHP46956.1 hypothetical protein HMPREF9476_02306 [Clostridium perfringens WAL-14572]MBO3356692.1 hypothetical protein [Clostridium perfringens]MBO3359963.1 hypothetical protein [Clostridium perfringens]MDU1257420.1 hypothetical protein [Clostridium perfringens]MDU2319956.1 hypothetical protein [Clostridium perfringens]